MAASQTSKPAHNFKDLTGQTFGRLTVIERVANRGKMNTPHWKCQCSCGVIKDVAGSALNGGLTISCGCAKRERIAAFKLSHDLCRSLEYRCWQGIKDRCSNPKNIGWKNYGGRGIRVCERWLHSFENFYADMGPKPFPRAQIDRIDNNGNYEPNNCRWVTVEENQRNRRSNRMIEFSGKTMTISEWSREVGISVPTIIRRLQAGWSTERTLTTPTQNHRPPELA